jgi:MinD-like ATPase involved in chromosome partitioning or flagellar assembly
MVGDGVMNVSDAERNSAARRGIQRLLHCATRGRVNVGASPNDQKQRDCEQRCRTPVVGNYKIGVLGRSGVGKTTVTAAIGSTLASLRSDDRVVAVDAAGGKLGQRVAPNATNSYFELVTDDVPQTYADIRTHLGVNVQGLHVLPGDVDNPYTPTPVVWRHALDRLDKFFAITVTDCSATMETPLIRTVARDLDAAVIVVNPRIASSAREILDWLTEYVGDHLMSRVTVVINNSDGGAETNAIFAIAEDFAAGACPVHELPHDKQLRASGIIDLEHGMSAASRAMYLQIAAAIGQHFGDSARRNHRT